MTKSSFPNLVNKHFGYLIDNYHFVERKKLYRSEPFSDGVIEFRSAQTVISVRKNRDEIMIRVGPVSDPDISRLSIGDIASFINQSKRLSPFEDIDLPTASEARVEKQITIYANLLKQYCEPMLRGDFSWWMDAFKYFAQNVKEEYRSATGLDLPIKDFDEYIRSKDNDSNTEKH